jgi:hypothetical protein
MADEDVSSDNSKKSSRVRAPTANRGWIARVSGVIAGHRWRGAERDSMRGGRLLVLPLEFGADQFEQAADPVASFAGTVVGPER